MPRNTGGAITIRSDPSAERLTRVWSASQRGKVSDTIDRVSDVVMDNLKRTTPQKTGALLASQRVIATSDLESKIVETVDPPYGLFQRQGVPANKINPILPVRKKALWWPGARHPVAAVRNHPGIKKNDYWSEAIRLSQGKMNDETKRTVAEIEESIDI